MTRTRIWLWAFVFFLAASPWARPANAQVVCTPPDSSNEAKLMAFHSAPIAFSLPSAPTELGFGGVLVSADLVPLPLPDAAISSTHSCYLSKSENTHLAPLFARPRLAVGLPFGFVVEASYLPPVKLWDARPNLASFAVSEVQRLASLPEIGALTLAVRGHVTIGEVKGPVTCPTSALQTTNEALPCYGRHASDDTFHPTMFGAEAALGLTTLRGWLSVYAGGGVTWLRPALQVNFTDATGFHDGSRVEVELSRGTVFGGLTVRPWRGLEVSGQVYSVPADVTTWRLGLGYRLN